MPGNLFWGYHAKNHHGNKPTAARETSGVIAFDAGTQWSVLHCFSTNRYPLRWTGSIGGDPSPCRVKLLETECTHTHTHTLSRFAALRRKNLNRHLKSRNERKKDRKSSAKRAGAKDRCSKSEYLALDWGRETNLKNHPKSLKESPRNDEKRKKESGGVGRGCMSMCVSEYLAL